MEKISVPSMGPSDELTKGTVVRILKRDGHIIVSLKVNEATQAQPNPVFTSVCIYYKDPPPLSFKGNEVYIGTGPCGVVISFVEGEPLTITSTVPTVHPRIISGYIASTIKYCASKKTVKQSAARVRRRHTKAIAEPTQAEREQWTGIWTRGMQYIRLFTTSIYHPHFRRDNARVMPPKLHDYLLNGEQSDKEECEAFWQTAMSEEDTFQLIDYITGMLNELTPFVKNMKVSSLEFAYVAYANAFWDLSFCVIPSKLDTNNLFGKIDCHTKRAIRLAMTFRGRCTVQDWASLLRIATESPDLSILSDAYYNFRSPFMSLTVDNKEFPRMPPIKCSNIIIPLGVEFITDAGKEWLDRLKMAQAMDESTEAIWFGTSLNARYFIKTVDRPVRLTELVEIPRDQFNLSSTTHVCVKYGMI